jgi:hypothetical protein
MFVLLPRTVLTLRRVFPLLLVTPPLVHALDGVVALARSSRSGSERYLFSASLPSGCSPDVVKLAPRVWIDSGVNLPSLASISPITPSFLLSVTRAHGGEVGRQIDCETRWRLVPSTLLRLGTATKVEVELPSVD